jgi:hypothetical protein
VSSMSIRLRSPTGTCARTRTGAVDGSSTPHAATTDRASDACCDNVATRAAVSRFSRGLRPARTAYRVRSSITLVSAINRNEPVPARLQPRPWLSSPPCRRGPAPPAEDHLQPAATRSIHLRASSAASTATSGWCAVLSVRFQTVSPLPRLPATLLPFAGRLLGVAGELPRAVQARSAPEPGLDGDGRCGRPVRHEHVDVESVSRGRRVAQHATAPEDAGIVGRHARSRLLGVGTHAVQALEQTFMELGKPCRGAHRSRAWQRRASPPARRCLVRWWLVPRLCAPHGFLGASHPRRFVGDRVDIGAEEGRQLATNLGHGLGQLLAGEAQVWLGQRRVADQEPRETGQVQKRCLLGFGVEVELARPDGVVHLHLHGDLPRAAGHGQVDPEVCSRALHDRLRGHAVDGPRAGQVEGLDGRQDALGERRPAEHPPERPRVREPVAPRHDVQQLGLVSRGHPVRRIDPVSAPRGWWRKAARGGRSAPRPTRPCPAPPRASGRAGIAA